VKQRDIYNISGLPPEVIAVTFAKTSRSPESFRDIANGLTAEGASKFHERWVVGYGHSSVAEAAVLHIAIENVSMAAAKALEDNRLASYTEKSTRYQVYDTDAYLVPDEILGTKDEKVFRIFVELLFKSYNEWHSRLKELFLSQGETDRSATSKACDAIRGILPIGTLTNLGMTINARSLCHTIKKLKGSTLSELRNIAEDLEAVGKEQVPTLMRHMEPYSYGWELDALLGETTNVLENTFSMELASLGHAFTTTFPEWKAWDPIPDFLEKSHADVRISYPFTTYRDLQRHRMCHHSVMIPSTSSFCIPRGIKLLGIEEEYYRLLCKCSILTRRLNSNGRPVVYHLPMHIRVFHNIHCNLRELLHIFILRTRPNGDPEYVDLVKGIEKEFMGSLPSSELRTFIEKLLTESRNVRQAKNQEIRVTTQGT